MSDFKAKMHQSRFRLGLCPRPRWRRLHRSPRFLAVFEGSTSKRRERGGEERERGKGKGERKGVGVEGGFGPPKNFGVAPLTPHQLAGRGKGREGRGTEREQRDRKQQKGRKGSWNRAADWLRPALNRKIVIVISL